VAFELAEARSFEPHPIQGHRGVQIVRSLVASDWAGARGGGPPSPPAP
jgi:hypothetical protein